MLRRKIKIRNNTNKKHLKNVGPIHHCEPPHAHSPDVTSGTVARAACASMSTTTPTTTTTRDRGDRYGPMEWAQQEENDGDVMANFGDESDQESKVSKTQMDKQGYRQRKARNFRKKDFSDICM